MLECGNPEIGRFVAIVETGVRARDGAVNATNNIDATLSKQNRASRISFSLSDKNAIPSRSKKLARVAGRGVCHWAHFAQ